MKFNGHLSILLLCIFVVGFWVPCCLKALGLFQVFPSWIDKDKTVPVWFKNNVVRSRHVQISSWTHHVLVTAPCVLLPSDSVVSPSRCKFQGPEANEASEIAAEGRLSKTLVVRRMAVSLGVSRFRVVTCWDSWEPNCCSSWTIFFPMNTVLINLHINIYFQLIVEANEQFDHIWSSCSVFGGIESMHLFDTHVTCILRWKTWNIVRNRPQPFVLTGEGSPRRGCYRSGLESVSGGLVSDLWHHSYICFCRGGVCVSAVCCRSYHGNCRVSSKRAPQVRVWSQSVLQEVKKACQVRVPYKSFKQECPTKVSRKRVMWECPPKLWSQSVLQKCEGRVPIKRCTKVSSKRAKSECPSKLWRKRRPARVSSKSVPQEFQVRAP